MNTFVGRAIALVTLLACTLSLRAEPISYEFDLTITAGPLTGENYSGSFSFDSGLVVPGSTIFGTDLFGSLSFVFHGVTYSASNTDLVELQWDAAGELSDFVIGTDCAGAAGCDIVNGSESWAMLPSAFAYAIVGDANSYISDGPTFRRVLPPSGAPEPGSLALLIGAAIAGLQVQRRHKTP